MTRMRKLPTAYGAGYSAVSIPCDCGCNASSGVDELKGQDENLDIRVTGEWKPWAFPQLRGKYGAPCHVRLHRLHQRQKSCPNPTCNLLQESFEDIPELKR